LGGGWWGMDAGHLYGGVMFMICVGRSGLVTMLVAWLGMGSRLFFGRMLGLVRRRLVSGLIGYMT